MARWILISVFATALLSAHDAVARDHVTTIRWSELQQQGQLEFGEIVQQDGHEELFISNDTDEPLTARIATLEPTGISTIRYQLEGTVRYEDVEQPGYLELWNHFAGQGSFFTRTTGSGGLMQSIHGSSETRDCMLPFQSNVDAGAPTKLEINLVLPAKGKVWIGPFQVYEFTDNDMDFGTAANSGAWWNDQMGGLVGGVLGTVFGLLGALIGTLSGMGRGQRFVIGVCVATIAFGAICLVAGVTAWAMSQPYAVYYPLLLTGVIGTVVVSSVLPGIRNRFAQAELHRIEAMDAVVE